MHALLLLLLLQTTTPPLVETLLQAVVGIAVPTAAAFLVMQVSKLTTAVNNLPDWEKRILVVVYSVIVTGIAHALNVKLPDAWGALGGADVQVALSAACAFLIHRIVHPSTAAK